VLGKAVQSFFGVLDALTLEDLMEPTAEPRPGTIRLVPGLPTLPH